MNELTDHLLPPSLEEFISINVGLSASGHAFEKRVPMKGDH